MGGWLGTGAVAPRVACACVVCALKLSMSPNTAALADPRHCPLLPALCPLQHPRQGARHEEVDPTKARSSWHQTYRPPI